MNKEKLTQTVLVNGQDVSYDKRITNKALLELCSNITMYNGFLCGHTSVEGVSPVSWIVMGWKMKVFRRAKMFSRIRVETWIQSWTRVRVLRNYAIYSEEGELLAKAAGEWVIMDGQTGNFLRVTPELLAPYGIVEEENNFPGYRFPDVRSVTSPASGTKVVTPGLQMLDYNGHVHNSEYINLAGEILPESETAEEVEVVYRTQILPGKPVRLEWIREEETQKVAIRDPDDGGLHALVMIRS